MLATSENLTVLLGLLDARDDSPLRHSSAIYAPNAWAAAPPEQGEDVWQERILMSASVVGWVMTIIEKAVEGALILNLFLDLFQVD